MTRPSDFTRGRILKAAESLFAERGYKDTSVRAVVAKARVNQAAINYHFGGKDGRCQASLRRPQLSPALADDGRWLMIE
jgi:AcrR family transcriptional regulator